VTSKETTQLTTGAQSSAEVITTIPVGAKPTGVAVHPVTLQVFVVNAGDCTVSVIDSSTFSVIATIPVGLSPQFVAVDPDRTTVGVTNFGDGTVSVIDTGTLTVTKTIPAGNRPYGIAAANNLFWVTNPDSGTVSKIKPKIGQVIGTFPVGAHPLGVAVHPDTLQVYVANEGGGTVSVIDSWTDAVTAIPVGSSPQGVAVDKTSVDTVSVANFSDSSVSVIAPGCNMVTKTISAGGRPSAIAAYNRRIYVTSADAGTVTVIDPTISAVIATIPVGPKPFGVAVGSGSQIYVANQGDNTVSVVQGP
jgi:YVTN family beta-propeller protein